MSDSDDIAEESLPTGEECKERCQNFARITGTDVALAMFYLQNREWNLQKSVAAFYREKGMKIPSPAKDGAQVAKKEDLKKKTPLTPSGLLQKAAKHEESRIRLMSWNLDGLDDANLVTRTNGVCQVIVNENPHIVFLQEVVLESADVLQTQLPEYEFIMAGDEGYFTAILLKKSPDIQFEAKELQPFYLSVMGRNLLLVKCKVKSVPCLLINTHLESTKSHAEERKRQLRLGFQKMVETKDRTVIFGGDMNLRDKEMTPLQELLNNTFVTEEILRNVYPLDQIKGIPEGVYDIWQLTGARPETEFTWDTSANDNKEMPWDFKPKFRFDRLYICHPEKDSFLYPTDFNLIGMERLADCGCFISDHWGLLINIDVKRPTFWDMYPVLETLNKMEQECDFFDRNTAPPKH